MSSPPLILVSRRSPLALQQSGWVKTELQREHPGLAVEILPLTTSGDRHREQPLPEIGGKGLFTKELEDALLEGRAHFAVHSLKDLPTEAAAGLALAAIPRREDPRDVFISRSGRKLFDLPSGVRIGTSSVRRAAQLRRLRSDVRIEPLRGNLDTRLRKLREGPLDAIVLAAAGLLRMGWGGQITEYLPDAIMCPAVGQGALAVQACAGDARTLEALSCLEHFETRLAVSAERALLLRLGGGCQVPIAAFARRGSDTEFGVKALVIRPDGSECVETTQRAPVVDMKSAEALGIRAAEHLLEQGASGILA